LAFGAVIAGPRSRALALLLFVAACKEADSVEALPAKTEPPKIAPWSEATLAVLETRSASCAWARLDPTSFRKEDLIVAPGDCADARWALSIDGKHGAFAIKKDDDWVKPTRFDFRTMQSERIFPGLPKGTWSFGFDPHGALVALVEARDEKDELPRQKIDGKDRYVHQGAAYEILKNGTSGLAHAERTDGLAWSHLETIGTAWDAGNAYGVELLEITKQLGPRAPIYREDTIANVVPDRSSEERALMAAFPDHQGLDEDGEPFGEWRQISTGTTAIYLWTKYAELPFDTAESHRRVGDRFVRIGSLEPTQAARYALQGPYLLVVGGLGEIELHDLRRSRPIYRGRHPGAAIWPRRP
jgi:hypothetical protein